MFNCFKKHKKNKKQKKKKKKREGKELWRKIKLINHSTFGQISNVTLKPSLEIRTIMWELKKLDQLAPLKPLRTHRMKIIMVT